MTSQRYYPDLDVSNCYENEPQDAPADASGLQMLPYFMPNEHEMNFMMQPNPMLPQFPFPSSQNFHNSSSASSSFQAAYGHAPLLPAMPVPNNDYNLNYLQSYPPATVSFPSAFIPNMAMYMPMYFHPSLIPYIMSNFHPTSPVNMSRSSADPQTAATVPMAEVDISTASISIPVTSVSVSGTSVSFLTTTSASISMAPVGYPATSTGNRTTSVRNVTSSTNSRTVSSLISTTAVRNSTTSVDIPTVSADIPATTTSTNVPTTSFRNSTTSFNTPKLVSDNTSRATKSITVPLALIRIPGTVPVRGTMNAASKDSQKQPSELQSSHSQDDRWTMSQVTEPSSCQRSLLLPVLVPSAKREYKDDRRIHRFQKTFHSMRMAYGQIRHCEPKDNLEDILRSLCSHVNEPRCNDSVILTRTIERIRQLKAIIVGDEERKNDLRQCIEELNDRIQSLQASLPSSSTQTAASTISQKAEMEQFLDRYTKEQARQDYRFWIMTRMMQPLMETLIETLSQLPADKALAGTSDWLRANFQPSVVRPNASTMLVYLATHTGILDNPSSLQEYIQRQLSQQ